MWHLKRHKREKGMAGLGQEEGRTGSKWASADGKNARLVELCRVGRSALSRERVYRITVYNI